MKWDFRSPDPLWIPFSFILRCFFSDRLDNAVSRRLLQDPSVSRLIDLDDSCAIRRLLDEPLCCTVFVQINLIIGGCNDGLQSEEFSSYWQHPLHENSKTLWSWSIIEPSGTRTSTCREVNPIPTSLCWVTVTNVHILMLQLLLKVYLDFCH